MYGKGFVIPYTTLSLPYERSMNVSWTYHERNPSFMLPLWYVKPVFLR